MSTSVTGHLAGEGAAEFLASATPVEGDDVDDDIDALRRAVYAPLGREGLAPRDVLKKIQAAMFPYDVSILKTEASLQRALREIVRIRKEEVPNMAASDPHYLLKLREVRSMAFVSELYLRASLERRESRAGHFREDYPHRSEDGLAWLVIERGEDGNMVFSRKRVPLERYRHPVTRYYQDNFRFVTEEH